MIIRMLRAKLNNDKEFIIWGSGKPKREWGYIEDIARIMIEGSKLKECSIEPINIAQNKAYSIGDSAKIISEELNFKGKLEFDKSFQDGAPIKKLDNKLFKETFPNFIFYFT